MANIPYRHWENTIGCRPTMWSAGGREYSVRAELSVSFEHGFTGANIYRCAAPDGADGFIAYGDGIVTPLCVSCDAAMHRLNKMWRAAAARRRAARDR